MSVAFPLCSDSYNYITSVNGIIYREEFRYLIAVMVIICRGVVRSALRQLVVKSFIVLLLGLVF